MNYIIYITTVLASLSVIYCNPVNKYEERFNDINTKKKSSQQTLNNHTLEEYLEPSINKFYNEYIKDFAEINVHNKLTTTSPHLTTWREIKQHKAPLVNFLQRSQILRSKHNLSDITPNVDGFHDHIEELGVLLHHLNMEQMGSLMEKDTAIQGRDSGCSSSSFEIFNFLTFLVYGFSVLVSLLGLATGSLANGLSGTFLSNLLSVIVNNNNNNDNNSNNENNNNNRRKREDLYDNSFMVLNLEDYLFEEFINSVLEITKGKDRSPDRMNFENLIHQVIDYFNSRGDILSDVIVFLDAIPSAPIMVVTKVLKESKSVNFEKEIIDEITRTQKQVMKLIPGILSRQLLINLLRNDKLYYSCIK